MKPFAKVTVLLVLGFGGLAMNPKPARAQSDWMEPYHNADGLYRRQYNVSNGQSLSVRTDGCTGNNAGDPDTVIFVLDGDTSTSGPKVTRGFNDDFNGTWCSSATVTNTSGSTRTYTVLITTYQPDTPATVDITTSVGTAPPGIETVTLGGISRRFLGFTTTTRLMVVPAPPRAGGTPRDSILYAIDPTISGRSEFDDDNGMQWLSTTASFSCPSNTQCWAVAGNFTAGNNVGGEYMLWSEAFNLNSVLHDADFDGVSDEVERELAAGPMPGLSGLKADSDGDGLSDYVELFGVPAPSLAGGDSSLVMAWKDANPVVQDLFLEVDFMADSMHSDAPYSGLGGDMNTIFAGDTTFTSRAITTHVEIDQNIGHSPGISFRSCGSNLNFYTIKNDPRFFDPLRRTVFHYAIAGHTQLDQACQPTTSSGIAEILGNDLIVTLQGGGSQNSTRGTVVHETGHNLFLDHNANDNLDPTLRSCVHSSVMNYRWQFNGWGNAGATLRSWGYSNGTCLSGNIGGPCVNTCVGGCVPAGQVTPKVSCPLATSGPNAGKRVSNGTCDCDRNEWSDPGSAQANRVSLAFQGSSNASSGTHITGATGSGDQAVAVAEYIQGGLGEQHKMTAVHQEIADRKMMFVESQGMIEGKHFWRNPENGKLYSVEQDVGGH